MSINTILRKLLFALAFTSLAVLPVPHLFVEGDFENELIGYTTANLTQRISKREFLVNAHKATLIKNLSRPESTSKVPAIFLLSLFSTALPNTLSSTILLL